MARTGKTDPMRIAVIGAGMAGLNAAQTLADRGYDVVVVEKSRGAGGRMSTRRQEGFRFDHGAQYFTARDPGFLRQVLAWQKRGLVKEWEPRIAVVGDHNRNGETSNTKRYIAMPSMNSICRALAEQLTDCRFGWQVQALERTETGWVLHSDTDETLKADFLLCTMPPEQASTLLADPVIDQLLSRVEMLPCWALMVVLDRPLLAENDAAFINQGPLSWVASQSARPGRPSVHAWVLHASPEWSLKHLDRSSEDVAGLLLEAAGSLPQARRFTVKSAIAHRWRYALARQPLEVEVLWIGSRRLAFAGDWCHGSRVEGAFLSGFAAARKIIGSTITRG